MSATTPRPPPLPAKRTRNLVLLILGIVLLLMALLGGGMFMLFRGFVSAFESMGSFSMEDYQCGKNLDELTLLKEEWVTAHDGKNGDVIPAADLAQMLAESEGKLVCPLDPQKTLATSYEIGPIGTDPKCKCPTQHEQKREERKKKKD